jgi:uncharacterized membrane protein YdjX (TVP38/TMEM64 family)
MSVKKYGGLALLITLFVLLSVFLFFYLDRSNAISKMIQNSGLYGVILALVMMALVSMTPVPTEGLLVLYQKVYGVYWGTTLAWMGANLGSLIIFLLARAYGQKFLNQFIKPEYFELVNRWVGRRGTWGLFIARLMPIPAFAANYIAGVLPSVRFWPYFWTAAISIIPYYVATALVYLGVSRQVWPWLIVGALGVLGFWGIGYWIKRRSEK